MQIQPILGYFWAIFGLYQPPGSPLLDLGPPFYISWIRPWYLLEAQISVWEMFLRCFLWVHGWACYPPCCLSDPPTWVFSAKYVMCQLHSIVTVIWQVQQAWAWCIVQGRLWCTEARIDSRHRLTVHDLLGMKSKVKDKKLLRKGGGSALKCFNLIDSRYSAHTV